MNVSHDWLRAFVPHALSAQEVSALLSAHVATVEGVEALRGDLAPFVVAQVVASEKVPDTKLSANKVDDGSGQLLDVVCGAPNVTVGAKYPLARVGTVIPGKGGITIERRKIRGFTSAGMLCSAMELGIGADHEGIMELDTDAAPGTPLLDVLAAGDVRLDVDVLANRPDLLSQRGIARELAALTGVALQQPPELRDATAMPRAVAGAREATADALTVRLDDAAGCPRYCAAVIRGVSVGPSPEWLVRRLEGVGARSINNVVDATNYLLHGLGQPVHAFDLAKLRGNTIVVRRARDGERLVTLDGTDRALNAETLVIADAERAVAVAGVMGGANTEVDDATTDVVLEVAYFDPTRVRTSRKVANVATDASYRFERGVDRAATHELLAHGAALIAAVAGGTVTAAIDVGTAPGALPPVRLTARRLTQVLGATVDDREVERLLRAVGFVVEPIGADRAWTVTPPAWRHDVTRDVDLVEEVARLVGFDALPNELRPFRPGRVPDAPLHVTSRRVREALVAEGLLEARPLPFVAGSDGSHLRVANPLAEDEPHLRRRVLQTLGQRAEHNLTRMQGNVRLFEIGGVFEPAARSDGLPRERMVLGVLVMGERRPPHWTEPTPPAFDQWDAKALAEVSARAAFPAARVALEARGEGDVLWTVVVDGVECGSVERVPLDAPVWAKPAYGIELELGVVDSERVAASGANAWTAGEGGAAATGHAAAHVQYRALPTTPAAEFDLALLVPDAVRAADVERVLREAAGELLERVALFDEYRGTNVPAGMRSLAWRITFRDPSRTLRDKEVEGRRRKLLAALEGELGVRQRTV